MARLDLIVPCYNEAARLDGRPFLELAAGAPDLRILFVDDGSTDGTSTVLNAIASSGGDQLSVLSLSKNGGKAHAVQSGISKALAGHPKYVGYWDADLSTPFSELSGLLAVLEARPGVDIAMGSRVKLLGRRIERRPARHYLGRVFATGASLALDLPVYDTQCGAKLFRVNDHIRRAFRDPFRSRWVMDVEILARYLDSSGRHDAASRICEVPLMAWTDVPGSKLKLSDGPGALWELLRIWRRRRE